MEGLTIRTDLPRRPSRTTALTPSSAWSVVSKPFQSKPTLSAGVMSSWVEKQNEDAFAQHKRIFYVPGLTSLAKSNEASYTRLPSDGRWEFKGIPVLTVNTHRPATGSELDLSNELDFWETVVPDKSQRPKAAETPTIPAQPEVLFDAEPEEEGSEDGLQHTNELDSISPRPLSPIGGIESAETSHVREGQMVFQPQMVPNPHLSCTQSGRLLVSKAWTCCGLRSNKVIHEEEKQ